MAYRLSDGDGQDALEVTAGANDAEMGAIRGNRHPQRDVAKSVWKSPISNAAVEM